MREEERKSARETKYSCAGGGGGGGEGEEELFVFVLLLQGLLPLLQDGGDLALHEGPGDV